MAKEAWCPRCSSSLAPKLRCRRPLPRRRRLPCWCSACCTPLHRGSGLGQAGAGQQVGGHHGGEPVRRGMAVRFAGASGGCGAVLRKTIGMRSALLCAYSAEKLLIMEQCRAVCGPPGIALGSWRKTASAALISCGNSRAAEEPSQAHCVRQLPRRGSFICANRKMTKAPLRGAGAERLRGFALSLLEELARRKPRLRSSP